MNVRVMCVNKLPGDDPYEGITHLGGKGWKWSREEMVAFIEAKTHTFYTMVAGNRRDIVVVNGPNGKYLRTAADGRWSDDLLTLPECP